MGEDELAQILTGHLLIERVLETAISEKLEHPDRLFGQRNIGFGMKLRLANSLGLLDEQHYSAAKAFNRIRNRYAHDPDYQVSINELSPLEIDWEPVQKTAFDATATKGVGEAAKIVVIFLCWSFQRMLR